MLLTRGLGGQMVAKWWLRPVADSECARGGGDHILAEKRGVRFTLFKTMRENAIISPRRGGRTPGSLRPMLDPPLLSL